METDVRQKRTAELRARAQSNRAQLIDRLDSEGRDDLADKLRTCGEPLGLTCVCCGVRKMVETRCKRRWCPCCARSIAAGRVGKYEHAVNSMEWPLFVTLTRPNIAELSFKDIRKLRSAFNKLRKQKWFAKMVKGGVVSVEITNIGNGWHPHLHCVMDCRWFSVKEPPPKPFESRKSLVARLQRASNEVAVRWAKCVGVDQAFIKVKRAYTSRSGPEIPNGSATVAREVLKYSVTAGDMLESPEPIGPMIDAIDACRLVTSFGSCFGKNMTVPAEMREKPGCESCNAVGSMVPDQVVEGASRSARRERERRGHR